LVPGHCDWTKPPDADKLLEQMARLLRLEWIYASAKAMSERDAPPLVLPPVEESALAKSYQSKAVLRLIEEHLLDNRDLQISGSHVSIRPVRRLFHVTHRRRRHRHS
jgi:hypothetical protein